MSWSPPSSPVTLTFGGAYSLPTSPVTLTFGGDGGGITPAIPSPTDIRVLAAAWATIGITAADARPAWDLLDRHDVVSAAAYVMPVQQLAIVLAEWGSPALSPGHHQLVAWLMPAQAAANHGANWSTPAAELAGASAVWALPGQSAGMVVAEWSTPAEVSSIVAVGFEFPPQAAGLLQVRWHFAGQVLPELSASWGPRDPLYYCTREYVAPQSPVTLVFSQPTYSGTLLLFTNAHEPLRCSGHIGGGIVPPWVDIPTDTSKPIGPLRRRSYTMTHTISLKRSSDDLAVSLRSVTISTDRDSWGWTWSAEVGSRGDALAIASEPTEVELEINGAIYLLLAESMSEQRAFGKPRYTVSGRSLSALLSSDYSARVTTVVNSAMTAAQIAAMALPFGWSLDWRMEDWPVAAGVFSVDGLAPIDIVARVAAAGGGRVFSVPDSQTLVIAPRWQHAPWLMPAATADRLVHEAVILSLTRRKEASGPQANAVFVRGEQAGVMVKVVRAGSAGDQLAGDIVDNLITHTAAARQRGTAAIADTGMHQVTELILPIMPALPPLLPGELIRVEDGITAGNGLVAAVSVTARRNADGAPDVSQSVRLVA